MKKTLEPEISLVIPVLNEEDNLPGLLGGLLKQKNVFFEVIFCEAGSEDGTLDLLKTLNPPKESFELRIVEGERGRGCQMNLGAKFARSGNLLFCHADTIFTDALSLRKALDAFEARIRKARSERMAGHFPLRFSRTASEPSLAYYYYECKTHLNRSGCINGDQGFLMRRTFFQELGGFDEFMGFLEDERMAENVFTNGSWFLLPGEILTSARRFEAEGLFERQVLNALIMNFSAIGWDVFFAQAGGIYRLQKDNGHLELLPFFQKIVQLLRRERFRKRLSLWYQTGTYVNKNAWQIAFFLDVRRSFELESCAEDLQTPCLNFFDSYGRSSINHPPGRAFTAVLTWLWFHGFRIWMILKTACR